VPRTPLSAAAAAARIADRRAAADDSALEMLPDDPLGVVQHVLTHRKVPAQVLHDDGLDSLAIVRAVRADLDRYEFRLAEMVRGLGVARATWQEIAGALGNQTRQGAEQRHLRLEFEREADGPRLERLARARRRAVRREAAWLRRNPAAIARCVQQVVAFNPDHDQDEALSDAMADLAEAHGSADSTPRHLLALLSLVVQAHDATSPHGPDLACAPLAAARRLTDEWPRVST
jgi:hypothetical protein